MDQIIIGALFALIGLLGLKFIKSSNKKDIEKELEYKVTDAKLKEQQKQKEQELNDIKQGIKNNRKKLKEMSPKEIENYHNEENN